MPIYMDNAATTPLCDSVKKEIVKSVEYFANPSSSYSIAKLEFAGIKLAEYEILRCLKLDHKKYNVYFTSGATEANNWVLRWASSGKKKKRIITTGIEHPSVYNTALDIASKKCEISFINANEEGLIDDEEVVRQIKNDKHGTISLISVMAVNNQTGAIQPLKRIGNACRENGIPFHVDATQAIGHIELDIEDNNIDMISASAHKFGGMKGIGFLVCKKDIKLKPFIFGGKQGKGLRAGTENVIGIKTTAEALKESMYLLDIKQKQIKAMRDYILKYIKADSYYLNGSNEHCVPGIINLSFKIISGYEMSIMLEANDILVSTTSACETGVEKTNRVLRNCGYDETRIENSIRISLSDKNTIEECKKLVESINEILELKTR